VSDGAVVSKTVRNQIRTFWSVAIVFIMVASAFAVIARAEDQQPTIWPSEDSYVPGETVQINGKGWVRLDQVTIEMTHPDFAETKTYVVIPDLYGKFVCTNYTAEGVDDWATPVQVKATQIQNGVAVEATTSFFDPAVTLMGYTLKPQLKWTTGDVKGYNEGDCVPYKVKLDRRFFGPTVTVTLGFDYANEIFTIYGIDYLCSYNTEPPTGPFSGYPPSATPFSVDAGQGIITDQHFVGIVVDTTKHLQELQWQFTLQFTQSKATVRWGAHLAMTDLSIDYKGASYWPGESLHVKIIELNPCSNQGNRDVPISVGKTLLKPPEMTLDKYCDPYVVLRGDTITFEIVWTNLGEADASCVLLTDDLDWVAHIIPGSFLFWTNENPTPMPPSPGPVITGQHFELDIGYWRGTGAGGINPPLYGHLQFQAIICENAPCGYWYNEAWLTYSDGHGGCFPPLYAECEFFIPCPPAIDIEKSGPVYGHVGETITYSYTVTNTGLVPLHNVDIIDDTAGVIALDQTLAVGETKSYTMTYTIQATDTDPLINIVTATGDDNYGRHVSDSDQWEVDILHPQIVVTKSANKPCAEWGETVWYTITVSNPDMPWQDTDLYNVVVSDPMLGTWTFAYLPVGGSQTILVPLVITQMIEIEWGDPLVNTVTATGEDITGWDAASVSASVVVDILHPAILISKDSDMSCAAIGEIVTYTITVSNPSLDTTMASVVVTDPMFGGIVWMGSLGPGASHTITPLWHMITFADPDPLVNTAVVDAWDTQQHHVTAEASNEVQIYHAMIDVTKVADVPCAAAGDTVIYTITVSNPSLDTWMHFAVYDPLLAPDYGSPLWTGYLAPLGSDSQSFAYVVPLIAPAPGQMELMNWVYVNGWDDQWYNTQIPDLHTAYAEDWAYVNILHPQIEVTKTANVECAAAGETVVYTITVTNPSLDTGMNYVVYDALLAPDYGSPVMSGYLTPGDSVSQDFEYTVPWMDPIPQEFELVNYVWVYGWDDQWDTSPTWWNHEAYDDDTNYIDILHPMIAIDKEANVECAAEGDTVIYTITVTNPSIDTGMWYEVYDPLLEPEYGAPIMSGYLTPLDSVSQSFAYLVPYIQASPSVWELVNYVWVNAWDYQYFDTIPPSQYHFAFADDWEYVDVYHPMIDVEKTVTPQCAAVGEYVTYTITVTNPTIDTWMNFVVHDPLLAAEYGDPLPEFSGYLAPLASESHSYVFQVPDLPATPGVWELVNFVYVDAWDDQWYTSPTEQNHVAYAEDTVSVDVVHPSIEIVKVPVTPLVHNGDLAMWDITITNTGDTWLNGSLSDDVMQYLYGDESVAWWEYIPIIGFDFYNLMPGQSIYGWTHWYVPDMDKSIVTMRNIVTVEATDHQQHFVTDTTYGDITIIHPEIDVTKVGPVSANAYDTITYYVSVTNTGDTTLYNVVLYDTLLAMVVATFPVLNVGETQYVSYTYVVPPGEGTVDNTVIADGTDVLGKTVEDQASWTVYKNGQVIVTKYADLNGDGVQEQNEPIIPLWVVSLEHPDGSIETKLTDSQGVCEFTGLEAGEYVLTESMPAGWVAYTPTSYSFTMGSGMALSFSFGNLPSGSISGHKWEDKNVNGVWDFGEPGVVGWTIYLDGTDINGDPVSLSTTTGPGGLYTFSGLKPGLYVVTEEDRDGWVPMTDNSIEIDVSLLEPFEITDVDFGNAQTGCISGFKWLDEWMNGVKDSNEHRLPGWKIWIEGTLANGEHFGPFWTLTDEHGYYSFCDLLPGVYTVWEEIPEGWVAVTPSSWEVTIGEGSHVQCAKFGNVKLQYIDGWKFLDWDMDGLFDGNEVGIAGWEITLTGWLNDGDWPWSPVGATPVGPITIYTDVNGHWIFPNLLPGIYTVTEASVPGWQHTTVDQYHVLVSSCDPVVDIKFGNVPLTCIWGYKFNDKNGDGINENEPGLAGWTIILEGLANDGQYVYIVMTTDEFGYFATCYNVPPGLYMLYELMEPGWMPIVPQGYYLIDLRYDMVLEPQALRYDFGNFAFGKIHGWKLEDINGDGIGDRPVEGWKMTLTADWGTGFTYTDVNGYFEFTGLPYGWYTVTEEDQDGWTHVSPTSYTVLVESGDIIVLDPFVNTHYGSICGWKFEDSNSNGVWDQGEEGIPGWPIYLLKNHDPDPILTWTGPGGYFCFDDLLPDDYMVWEGDIQGWTHTTVTGYVLELNGGDDIMLPPFGNFHNVYLTLFKYEDTYHDGYYDYFWDTPIEGWQITVSGPGVPGGSVTVMTDEFGYAYVELTAAGLYTVTEEQRDGWCPTTPTTVYVNVVSGYADPWIVEFGNFKCVNITIFKYEDVDHSGDYDPTIDLPIEGWWFAVEGFWGDTWDEYQTDENGLIQLEICHWDWWYVFEYQEDGWCQVTPGDQSGYSFETISGHAYNMQTGQEQYVYEFGNFQCVEITVFKYWDKCSNGWYDPYYGDVPIEGWLIGLINEDYELIALGETDENGIVTFELCEAGTFYIAEESRYGWSWITPPEGYYQITVESGDVVYVEFGNYEWVQVPIFKYEDVNSNGLYDNGDVPIEGWYFEMTRAGDPFTVYSGYTDENGMLVFTVDRSGIYTIVEADDPDYVHVNPASGMSLVNVMSGQVVPVQEFGNFHKAYIVVCKIDDKDADGEFDIGFDEYIAGWQFQLWEAVGEDQNGYIWQLVDTKETCERGCVVFVILHAGIYKVTEESRIGWLWICPANGETLPMLVVSGCYIGPIGFFNFKKGTIYGYKWNDLDGDGVWDQGEPALPGWTIWFEGWGFGYMTGFAVTDENGYYEFTGLPPGEYVVWEVGQPGWIPTTDPDVWVDIWGHSEVNVSFGNFELGCIEGYKYEDMNGNGIYDNGDVPIPDWTIYLSWTTGIIMTPEGPISAIVLIAITTTDENGHYQFCGLGPSGTGWYIVEEETRADWVPTTPTSENVVMTSGAHVRVHDFLNYEKGSICGWKFEDLNCNGIWDLGEPPLPDWPIYLLKNHDLDPTVTWTDGDGYFCFDDLLYDHYMVWEAQIQGWTPTTVTGYTVWVCSGSDIELDPFGNFHNVWIPIFKYEDVNGNGEYDNGDVPIPNWMFTVSGPCFNDPIVVFTDMWGEAFVEVTCAGTYTITEEDVAGWEHVNPASGERTVDVQSGDMVMWQMFGNFRLAMITVQKFYDWNLNGVQDPEEEGLGGWVIHIDGYLVNGGEVHFTRVTDSTGYFEITGLSAGIYNVYEDLLGHNGWFPTTNPDQWFLIGSGTTATASFGNAVHGDIYGWKFYDKNMDGIWNDEEPPLAGWTIVLDGTTTQGVPVHMEYTTGMDGYFIFANLQPGTYQITEVSQLGWQATVPLPLVIDVSGMMVYFGIEVDIGNIQFGKICGYKFLDTYEDRYPFWPNGIFDPDEFGLGNWKITLQGRTDDGQLVDRVAFTDNEANIGWYCFDQLLPGRYWVNETLLVGYYATRPIANLVIIPAHPMGPVCIRIDFGNLIPSPDPQMNFVLKAGWNMWSAPIKVNGLTAKSLLNAIGSSGLMVVKLNKTSGKYEGYVTGDPVKFNFPILQGQGYYIWATAGTSFVLTGLLTPPTSVELKAGWNIIGYSQLKPTMASEVMKKVSGTSPLIIVSLDTNTGKYKGYVTGDPAKFDFLVTPGKAYFIWVDGAGVLTI
jgi:serine-aspartate repeat-containing protein C/D/E